MGNHCSDDLVRSKTHRKSIRSQKVQKISYSLSFQIKTWENLALPNIRNPQCSIKTNFIIMNQGQLIYCQNRKKMLFIPKKDKKKYAESDAKKIQSLDLFDNGKKLLLTITKDIDGYNLQIQNPFSYQMIRQPKQILQGDTFLLGGTQYKFLKFISSQKFNKQKMSKISKSSEKNQLQKSGKTHEYLKSICSNFKEEDDQHGMTVCRICSQPQTSKSDPLISPCDCTGSVRYYHLKCWVNWAFTQQKITQNFYIGNIKRQKCDVCRKSLVSQSQYRQTIAAILSSVYKIKPPFLVFEALKPLENFPYYNNIELSFMILSFANKTVYTIGRSFQVDILVTMDVSISRMNSIIQMKNDKIFLSDARSKHGTYIKTNGKININSSNPKTFLYKNNLIDVKVF